MAKSENIILFETADRAKGFALYDALRKGNLYALYQGSYLTIEVKVVGDNTIIYAVPFYSYEELQPGPRAGFDGSMLMLRGMVAGFDAAWRAKQ